MAKKVSDILEAKYMKEATSKGIKDPKKNFKKCEMGCAKQAHPYGALRMCEVVLAKPLAEVRSLVKQLPKSRCGRCLSITTNKHTTNTCPRHAASCGTCYRYNEPTEIQATHLAWSCRRHPGVEEHLTTLEEFAKSKPDKRVTHTTEIFEPTSQSDDQEEGESEEEDPDDANVLFANQILSRNLETEEGELAWEHPVPTDDNLPDLPDEEERENQTILCTLREDEGGKNVSSQRDNYNWLSNYFLSYTANA